MACIHTQGLLIPFSCLLIKWIEYAKFTGRSSKEAKLYFFFRVFQFTFLHFCCFSAGNSCLLRRKVCCSGNLESEAVTNGASHWVAFINALIWDTQRAFGGQTHLGSPTKCQPVCKFTFYSNGLVAHQPCNKESNLTPFNPVSF